MGQRFAITHIKADFDAIASAWAACKLYDCDNIVVATEMEPNVAAFFKSYSELNKDLLAPLKKIKPNEAESFDDIDHLIITDCKQKKRLGTLEHFVKKAKKITIFDHHPAYAKDISADEEFLGKIGSTTTIIVSELLKKGAEITPFDATLYLLAIYEDTGMMTFSSTTPEDVRIVAQLMEKSGDVTVITDFVKREFSREQVFILNELLMNMSTITVDGVNITYSYASIDEYIEELAFLAHRMMEMEALETLFIMVRSGPRIVFIGRSKNAKIDASKIAGVFGGGGHPAAASANIKSLELHEAVDLLKVTLREQIKPVRFVREVMTAPAKSIDADANFDAALDFTLMHNLNHMPVVKNGRAVGVLSRKDILQGIKHGLANESISLLMQVEIERVTPDTPFRMAEDIMINLNQKLLPVEEKDELVGVVTRTDLLRLLHEESSQRSNYEEGAKTRLGISRSRNVTDLLHSELSPTFFNYLKEAGELATEEGVGIYLVGGFVRDLLMGRKSQDIDLVVEGDAVVLATLFAKKKNAKLVLHDKFKTATVTMLSGDKIDFATARTEYYCMPGAAPSVECSSLRSDLTRRDFTINAMAIRIDGKGFGQLVDYFGGQRDLLDKKIRVLHSLSFVDDPTRAFRALRFAGRFGFTLGSHTERLLKHAESLGLFSRIPGGKLFIELKYILMEPRYMAALALLKKYNMLGFLAFNLSINESREKQFALLDELWVRTAPKLAKNTHLWAVRYALLMNDYNPDDYNGFLNRLHVEETLAARLLNIYNRSRFACKKVKSMKEGKPSDYYKIFIKLTEEELLMLGVLLTEKRVALFLDFMEHGRTVKTLLNGHDLMEMGIPQSKVIGDILDDLLYAKIDGLVKNIEDEKEFVAKKYDSTKNSD